MSKVLIVDDHPAIRLAVRLLFERDGFTIVGEADNGAEALQVARKKSPDLAHPGHRHPQDRRSRSDSPPEVPEAGHQGPGPDPAESGAVRPALPAGRRHGLRQQKENLSELLLAAKAVLAGYIHFPTGALRSINQQSRDNEARMLESLSDREMTVLQYLANGNTNKAIAQQLFLSEKTVSTYKSRIMLKLNAHSLAGLIDFARRHELI